MAEIVKRNFTAGEISPSLHARVDLKKYQSGLATLRNFLIHPEGGISTRPGFEWVGHVKDNSSTFRLIPFQYSTEQTYVLEFTDLAMRVIKDGGYVTNTPVVITGITSSSPAVVTATSHGYSNGDTVYISAVAGMLEINNGWYTVANVAANTFELSGVDSSGYTAYTSGGTSAGIHTVVSPYAEADLYDIKYTQSADVMTFVHKSYDPTELSRTGHTSWSFDVVSYASTVTAPTGLAAVTGGSGGGSYNKTYKYTVSAVVDGIESLPSIAASTGAISSLSTTYYVSLSWTAVADAEHYNIYKAESEVSEVYGWIGKSITTSHKDYNIAPLIDDAPQSDRQPFSDAGEKPSTVNYYQQRIMFGASQNKPQTVYGSQSGNYHSLRVSVPTKDDDAVTFTIASQKVNEIRHIVSLDAMIILTSSGEWHVTEGQDDVLTPSTVGVKPQSYYGASHVQPVLVGSDAIYTQDRGSRLRTIGYAFETDNYSGSDLSIMAQHLMDQYTIIDMAYAQEPYSIIYALRDDGVLLCCTYQKEHEVVGWYHYDTPNASIKSIAVIAEGNQDILYAGIERTINSQTVRYVERLRERNWITAENAFCMDAAARYSSTSTDTVYGLHHLEGETVTAFADGNVVMDVTVSDGMVTIPNAAETILVGITYECDVETLDVDSADPKISIRGDLKSVSQVVFKFLNSRGGWVGPNESNLTEIKPRFTSDGYDAIQLRTYEHRVTIGAGWSEGGRIFFRQSDPVPATILVISPEVSIG